MSIKLISAQHGPAVKMGGLLYDGDDLQFSLIPDTTVGVPAIESGAYNVVTIDDITQKEGVEGVFIWRAALTPASNDEELDDIAVVVKLAATEEAFQHIVNEGKFYATHLQALVHDSLVPICYGTFEATNRASEHAFGCLILQDCGDRVLPDQFEGNDPEGRFIGYVEQLIERDDP